MEPLTGFHQDPIWNVLIRFVVTLIVLTIIIRYIYYRYSKKKRNVFAFFQMGIMLFLVCILLQNVEIQLGVALGLFAIFAIVRFRSENLNLRDMAYFFTVIGVSVINSMADFIEPVRGPIVINSIIIIGLYILEFLFNKREYLSVVTTYDKLDLLAPDKTTELLTDLSARTRKKVKKVKIRKYDLVKNSVELEIYFKSPDSDVD
jgi:uncharacterized membrane protein